MERKNLFKHNSNYDFIKGGNYIPEGTFFSINGTCKYGCGGISENQQSKNDSNPSPLFLDSAGNPISWQSKTNEGEMTWGWDWENGAYIYGQKYTKFNKRVYSISCDASQNGLPCYTEYSKVISPGFYIVLPPEVKEIGNWVLNSGQGGAASSWMFICIENLIYFHDCKSTWSSARFAFSNKLQQISAKSINHGTVSIHFQGAPPTVDEGEITLASNSTLKVYYTDTYKDAFLSDPVWKDFVVGKASYGWNNAYIGVSQI